METCIEVVMIAIFSKTMLNLRKICLFSQTGDVVKGRLKFSFSYEYNNEMEK